MTLRALGTCNPLDDLWREAVDEAKHLTSVLRDVRPRKRLDLP
jgi:hypothetical protein